MGSPTTDTQSGLPWPDDYQDLLPVIRQEWGVEDIYLVRKLAGGKSGALVYAADMTSRAHTGQAILKLDSAPDPERERQSESDRHSQAFASAPAYAVQHLPKLIQSLQHGEHLAILSTIAGRGLEYMATWYETSYGPSLSSIRHVARDLLEQWNHDYTIVEGIPMPQELLAAWLGSRLDPNKNRLHGFLAETCGLSPDEPSFVFEGHWYPNPLAFASSTRNLPETLRLRAVLGHCHGDFHAKNLLVGSNKATTDDYFLIDLAFYQDRQYLFFDHAYFEINYLLLYRGGATATKWEAILDQLCLFHRSQDMTGLSGEDVGIVNMVQALRREVMDWVDRHESHRLSYMENQYLLARIAAGLNFANKRLSDEYRRRAFVYAAHYLKDYLKLNHVDWPKHGPVFELGTSSGTGRKDSELENAVASEHDYPPLPEKPGIAVMPFENDGGDQSEEYFADGISEEIIAELSRIDWLMVISRGSTFSYKGQRVNVKDIGKQLGVHYVVEGSVRKAGQRVRISAKLLDAQAGNQIWAQRFDRDVEDIFTLEEEIAGSITETIDTSLKTTEREKARRKRTGLNAWDKFQKGLWHFYRNTPEDDETAKKVLSEAISMSPQFASSYAVRSMLETRKIFYAEADEPEDTIERARGFADKAIALDDENSLAHVAMARVLSMSGQHESAVIEAETAVSLNPSSSAAYLALAGAWIWSGRAEEAQRHLEMAIRLSPRGPLLYIKRLAQAVCAYVLGDYAMAEKYAKKSAIGSIIGPMGHILHAVILARLGRLDEAQRAVGEARRKRENLTLSTCRNAWGKLNPGYIEMITEDLHKLGLPD